MRRLLFICLMVSYPLYAAANRTDSIGGRKQDPLYFQLYGGINKSANEHLPWTEFSSCPWSYGAFIGLGKEWSPLWGWRAAIRYNHNKSRNVPVCESSDTWGWDNVGLFGDVTYDVTDALTSKSSTKHKRFNLKAFAGIGAAYTFGFPEETPLSYTDPYSSKSKLLGGVRAGLTATYQAASCWRIGLELSHTQLMDGFNGVDVDVPTDGRSNLKVGVTYLFKKQPRRIIPVGTISYDNRLKEVPMLPMKKPNPEETKNRVLQGRAFLDFPVNETTIYPNYRRNPQELKHIRKTIDSALFDKSFLVTRITLHGYASPESPYDNNTRLAKGRTAALKEYLRGHYQVKDSIFQTQYTPEDWQNLRNFIAEDKRRKIKGDIWYENAAIRETPETPTLVTQYREELIQLIDRDLDPDEKEAQLKLVGQGKPYQWLLQHVYPGLRHTDYTIEYVVRPYPVDEGRNLIYTHPEALSLHEMYLVAQSYDEGSDGWLDALTIAANQYPEDKTANLNAACACVRVKRLKDAKRYLEHSGDSEDARYVGRVIRAMEGKAAWQVVDGEVIINENEKGE